MNEKKYIEAMKCVEIPTEIKHRILRKSIQTKQDKEKYIMMSKNKVGLIAAAAVLVLGITVFAANGIISNWYSSSSSEPDYKTLPTIEQAVKDVGYAPVLIESFDNGYIFDSGKIVKNVLTDADNNSVEKFKSFSCQYTKDGDAVILSQEKYNSEMQNSGTLISSENGTDIYFMGYTNKVVPASYEMTEDDKKAEQNGELIFSYGSDKVSIIEVRGISWVMNDMHLSLMQMDGKLSADDLVWMANCIIAQNK